MKNHGRASAATMPDGLREAADRFALSSSLHGQCLRIASEILREAGKADGQPLPDWDRPWWNRGDR